MITIDGAQVERARAALAGIDNGFSKAMATSLNRASEGFITDAVRGTTGRYHVKASEVRKSLKLKRAGAAKLMSVINASGRRKSISEYKLTPTAPTPGRRKELKGAVKKDGMKALRGAFFVRGKPFIRDGSGLKPIISPSVPQIVKNKETVAEAEKGASMRFRKQLDHEILRLMGVFKR
ncbi:MAG: phage tail protein [Candidatus Pacebacteria bacterium]|nr:phage tail protein [Candidatus Paceibacterota bacterium]